MSALDDIMSGYGLHYGEAPADTQLRAKQAIKQLMLEIVDKQDKVLLARYQDETDDEAKGNNEWQDYARYQLNTIKDIINDL